MAGRRAEELDNGTSLYDSGFEIIPDSVLPIPGLDLDRYIPCPGKMLSYESPTYQCTAPKAPTVLRVTTLPRRARTRWRMCSIGVVLLLVLLLVTKQ